MITAGPYKRRTGARLVADTSAGPRSRKPTLYVVVVAVANGVVTYRADRPGGSSWTLPETKFAEVYDRDDARSGR